MRRSSFLVRAIGIGILLHIYVGFRLIPELPVSLAIRGLAVLWLVLSCVLIPAGVLARTIERQPLADRVAWICLLSMGVFSSLLVPTLLRDLMLASLLTVDALSPRAIALDRWRIDTAAAVPMLALLWTAVGFVNPPPRAQGVP